MGKFFKQIISCTIVMLFIISNISLPTGYCNTAATSNFALNNDSRTMNFNKDWKFFLGNVANAYDVTYNDQSWTSISIPHDFSISQSYTASGTETESGMLPGGTGWYRKTFTMPNIYDGKIVTITFDGVYSSSYIYINGRYVGANHYGYNAFSFDLTEHLICDGSTPNVIAVKVVHTIPSSRWYSGSGIYRDVKLTVTNPIHFELNGTKITTNVSDSIRSNVEVTVKTKIRNASASSKNITIRNTTFNSIGETVSSSVTASVNILSNKTVESTALLSVSNPNLWSPDSPALYYVVSEILDGSNIIDTYSTEFGFRYYIFDYNTGFSLNGQKTKLKGVCMHHDLGAAIGSASYYDGIYRQIVKLKDMGCNAIRTSHNIGSRNLIEICNKLGMLVMEEAYDGWTVHKQYNKNDFGAYFARTITSDNKILGTGEMGNLNIDWKADSGSVTWAEFAIKSMTDRDKNDPSVFMWSIGNEIQTDAGSNDYGIGFDKYPSIANSLVSWINEVDGSRLITEGDNKGWLDATGDGWAQYWVNKAVNVLGVNYNLGAISSKRNQMQMPVIATESTSAISSRGIYYTTNTDWTNHQITAYDRQAVNWGNKAAEAWQAVIKNDYISGQFVWTGFDYLGEPTPWNNSVSSNLRAPNSSYFGIIDTAGFEKDSYYLYRSLWNEKDTTLHIVPGSWTKSDLVGNSNINVIVYSNASKIQLFLNDRLMGESTANINTTASGYTYKTWTETGSYTTPLEYGTYGEFYSQFLIPYSTGTLYVKAFDASGNEITNAVGTKTITTNSDTGSKLSVKSDKSVIKADGYSLAFIEVEARDSNNNYVNGFNKNIQFTLTGNGEIIGVDNGNAATLLKGQQPTVLTSKTAANINAFSGKALVVVRSTNTAGSFTLTAASSGVTGNAITIQTTNDDPPVLMSYDLTQSYTVKKGDSLTLQTVVNGIMSNNTTVTGNIVWGTYSTATEGTFTIQGTLYIANSTIPVSATIIVTSNDPTPSPTPSADILTQGTTIIQHSNLMSIVEGTNSTNTKTITGGTKIYRDDWYGQAVLRYDAANASYTSPLGTYIEVPLSSETSINEGDICIVTFKGHGFNPNTGIQKYQFAFNDSYGSSVSAPVAVNSVKDTSNPRELSREYVVLKSTAPYDSDGKFQIGVGGPWQTGIIGDVNVINLGQDYSMSEIREALGLTLSKDEILSAGTTIISNSNLLAQAKNSENNYVEKHFSVDDPNKYYYENAFDKCEGIVFNTDAKNDYASVKDAKVSIPIADQVKAGDILLISFQAQNYWSAGNPADFSKVCFALGDSVSNDVKVKETFGWQTSWTFDKTFIALIQANSDYSAGSTLDICVGYNNYQILFLGNLSVKNLSNDFSLDDINNTLKLTTPGLSDIIYTRDVESGKVNAITVNYSSLVNDTKPICYFVALYNGNTLIDVAMSTVVPEAGITPYAVKFNKPSGADTFQSFTSIKVMALSDVSTTQPIFNYLEKKIN